MNLQRGTLLRFIIPGFIFKGFSQIEHEVLEPSLFKTRKLSIKYNNSLLLLKIYHRVANKKIRENLAAEFPHKNKIPNYLHQFVLHRLSFGSYPDIN